jgi:S-adenosylmethionine hydrolase
MIERNIDQASKRTTENRILSGKIEGRVVSISEAGVAITDVPIDRLSDVPMDESVSITCEGHTTLRLFYPRHNEPDMTFLAMLGESGFLEICLVGDNVEKFLGIRRGSHVLIIW